MKTKSFILWFLWLVATVASQAQTLTPLVYFDYSNGADPCCASMVQGPDGDLFGTTALGSIAGGSGTFFKVTPAGTLTSLYNFSGEFGANPVGAIFGNGVFYGTTESGGANNYGTVFTITSGGFLTTLWSFTGLPHGSPTAPLVQASNGDFYGTTSDGDTGYGSIFKITTKGVLTYLYRFNGIDGRTGAGALIQAADGHLYGTTAGGGLFNFGTVFKMTLGGTLTTIHSFSASEGQYPNAALVEGSNGEFYGITTSGGINNGGTVFKVTPTGEFATLHSFDSTVGPGGSYPYTMIRAADGNFYGTTLYGGSESCSFGFNCGTIFKITPEGALTTVYDSSGADAGFPSSLVQSTNGVFYGTGGPTYKVTYGSLFNLSDGHGPFVESIPAAGAVGSFVRILGTGLDRATGVAFNGAPAKFTPYSASQIFATVPTGATTGKIQVTGPGGTLLSNVPFRVIP